MQKITYKTNRAFLVIAIFLLANLLISCNSALHHAARRGDINTAVSILNKGADVNVKGIGRRTPLHKAAQEGNLNIIKLLIERGADINARDKLGRTPLDWAIIKDKRYVARFLIEHGADVHNSFRRGRYTTMSIAQEHKSYEIVALIQAAMNKQNDSKNILSPNMAKTNIVAPNAASEKTEFYLIDDLIEITPTIKMPINPKAYAVVIGIEKYRERLPDAPYAKSDAETVAKYLTESMGFEKRNVAVLINQRASRNDLNKYLGTWLKNRANKPDAKVFIYFSGHGAPDVKTKSAYLVPYDGDPTYIADTGYPLKKLYDTLGKLKAKEIVVALDSCFSGAGGRSVIAKGARPLALRLDNPLVSSGKIIVLSASSGSQASSTYDAKGHGLFTYYLLKGLHGGADKNKSGKISVKELYKYISPKVETIALEEYNNEQTPQLIDPSRKSGKMVLIGK